MHSKRKRVRKQNDAALLNLAKLGKTNKQAFWIKKLFRTLRRDFKARLAARNVLKELEKSGQFDYRILWLWKLCIKLRRHLTDRISDQLIVQIVISFYKYETNRLQGKLAKIRGPRKIQYWTTIGALNSTYKEISFWSETNYSDLAEELTTSIDDCIKKLGVIARQDISSLFLEYGELEKHSFYFTALLILMQSFRDGKKERSLKPRGKVDNKGLNLADYAAIFYYSKGAGYYKNENNEVEYNLFINKHCIDTDTKRFKSAVHDVQELNRRKANKRLFRIENIIDEQYPKALQALKLDQKKAQKD